MEAKQGSKVRVHYRGILEDGTVFDSSYEDKRPVAFTVGSHAMLDAFEEGVVGMREGEVRRIVVSAADAYGARDESLVEVVPLEEFPRARQLKVGAHLPLPSPKGGAGAYVVALDDETVTFDYNHPLAGKDLAFEIELLAVLG